MKKLFKNKAFAVCVLVLAILLSSLYGLRKRPPDAAPDLEPDEISSVGGLDTGLSSEAAALKRYIVDQANILSGATEDELSLYNANWDAVGGSILAVVTTGSGSSDLEETAWDWAMTLALGENAALLLMHTGVSDCYLLSSGDFAERFDGRETTYLDAGLSEKFFAEQYDEGVLELFRNIHNDFFAGSYSVPAPSQATSLGGGIQAYQVVTALFFLFFIIFIVLTLNIIDELRYNTWNRRYGTMGAPPVVFRPIFWWHRPGSAWYR
ncbi:MAG: TPM domain-containing protein, partial [Oscillospiraceae bacterium]|nr:TPM domain-containing protein [Oscillospiraceae bacterium]